MSASEPLFSVVRRSLSSNGDQALAVRMLSGGCGMWVYELTPVVAAHAGLGIVIGEGGWEVDLVRGGLIKRAHRRSARVYADRVPEGAPPNSAAWSASWSIEDADRFLLARGYAADRYAACACADAILALLPAESRVRRG